MASPDVAVPTTAAPPKVAANSLWRLAVKRLFRRRSSLIGMTILGILILVAIFARVIAPYDPTDALIGKEKVTQRQKPCVHLLGCPADQPEHLMGIDANFRDEFSRVIFASRISLVIGIASVSF